MMNTTTTASTRFIPTLYDCFLAPRGYPIYAPRGACAAESGRLTRLRERTNSFAGFVQKRERNQRA